MELELLKQEADKLGYKLVKKTKNDLLKESNIDCERCTKFSFKPIGRAVVYANEFPICQDCYNTISMY